MEQEQEKTTVSPATSPVAQRATTSSASRSTMYLWWVGVAVVIVALVAAICFFIFQKINNTVTDTKVYHVGVLDALDYFTPTIDDFKQKMTELGYVEGKNIVYDIEKEPSPVGNQAIIKKFVDEKVDLILSFPTEASLEAKEGTKDTTIPIIATEPATEGNTLVDSVQRPGGNITAVRFPVPEVAARRFEILHEIAPQAKRFWIPYLKDYPTVAVGLAAIRDSAKALGITLIEAPFSTPDEVTTYLKAHESNPGMDAILTIPEPISILPPFINQIYTFADTHKIPIAGAEVLDSDSGPVFSFIPSAFNIGQLAAPSADKIFKGTPAGTIPVITPESVFIINYKAATRLGLTISESLLSTANKITH